MLIIGLTGGIGSGKSTVAKLFSEHNIPIIDTDILAHTLTQTNQDAYHSIIQHFGQNILLKNHSIDRKQLRHLIFQNMAERRWLENMLHPLILTEVKKQIQTLSAPYCIVVIPLLFETMLTHPTASSYDFLNRILVVDTPISLQIERASSRDKTDANAIQAILKTQVTREQRLAQAQDIMMNDGKLDDLIPQVEQLHQLYLNLSLHHP